MASFFEKGLAGAAKMGGQYLMATSLSDHKAKIQVARDKTLADYATARQDDFQAFQVEQEITRQANRLLLPSEQKAAQEVEKGTQLKTVTQAYLDADDEASRITAAKNIMAVKGTPYEGEQLRLGKRFIQHGGDIFDTTTEKNVPLPTDPLEIMKLAQKLASDQLGLKNKHGRPMYPGLTVDQALDDAYASLTKNRSGTPAPPSPGVDTSKPPPSGKGVTTAVKGPATKGNNAQIQNLESRLAAIKANDKIGMYDDDPEGRAAAEKEYTRIQRQLQSLRGR